MWPTYTARSPLYLECTMSVPTPHPTNVVSRRQILAGGTTLAVGGTALMAVGSEPARASVEIDDDLEVSGANHSGDDGSVEAVTLSVTGSFSFSTNGASEYSIDLQVASAPDAGDWQSIDWQDDTVLANSSGGSYELSGSVLEHGAWSAEDFSAGAAETNETDVPVRVILRVFDGGDEAVVEAGAETIAPVSVTNESVEVTGDVTGDGSISVTV